MGNGKLFSEDNGLPKVVIVGGGFGGVEAARALARTQVEITLIDRTNHHVFQPLLYQVATAGLSPADIAAPIRGMFTHQQNIRILMAEVEGIDHDRKLVKLADREIPYDYLVLATGARHSYFNHPEWEQFAPGLKTISDATSLRRTILQAFEAAELETDADKRRELLTFVLVGGGPTGVEMAGSIIELARMALKHEFCMIDPSSARVLLFEAEKRILMTFDENLAEQSRKRLEEMGVEVHAGERVEQIDADGVIVNGERIASRCVIWTAGVTAAAGKWLKAPVDRAGRIQVQPNLEIPGEPNIFAVGDTATLLQDGHPLPGVAQVAIQGGKYVGRLITARVKGSPEPQPFHYHDRGNLATIGRAFAIIDMKHFKQAGFFAWLFWLFVHILFLISFRNRILVFIQWAWAYLTYQRGVRLITPEIVPIPKLPEAQAVASSTSGASHAVSSPSGAASPAESTGVPSSQEPKLAMTGVGPGGKEPAS